MSAVLEQLASREAERREALQAEWWRVVKAVGDGEECDAEEVEELLGDLGRTPAELATAVQTYRHRKALRATAEGKVEWVAESSRVAQQIAAEAAAIDEKVKTYQLLNWQLQQRQAAAHQAIQAAEQAAEELRKTCPYTDRAEAIRDARRTANRIGSDGTRLRKEAADCERAAEANEQRGNRDTAARQRAKAKDLIGQATKIEEQAAAHTQKADADSAILMEP